MHSSSLKRTCFSHRAHEYSQYSGGKDFYPGYFNTHSSPRSNPKSPPPKHAPLRVEKTCFWGLPPKYEFTFEDLAFSLYGKSVIQPIDTERIQRKRRMSSDQIDLGRKNQRYLGDYKDSSSKEESMTEFFKSQSKRSKMSEKIDIAPSNAVMTFQPEVQLCMSSLPGGHLGVCARLDIPKDTVIGPYRGRRVRPEDMKMGNGTRMSYTWEIYKNGKLDHYLDGSDENVSCWMRFIRSARNKEEQNVCAIQHGENIFYRTLVYIHAGAELLVWYEEKYEEYFGIPILSSANQKPLQEENRTNSRQPLHLSLCREPFTPAMLKTMEKTRLWIDERLGINSCEDDEVDPRLPRRDSYDSSPSSHNSDGETENLNPRLWKCTQCRQSFNQRSALRIHVCPTQTKQPFDCGQCSLSFADPKALRAHVETHTNDRLFKCGYCARRFAGATTLTNHIRTHTGEKPFSCKKCGKHFSQASQLCRHQRIAGDCV